ncbi:MAG: SRPBCC domain-containing protein [Polyangiaceae bacterium]
MSPRRENTARVVADLSAGRILGTVEIRKPPERVFRALTSDEIVKWWGSDDTYRNTGFTAELRVGGKWRAEGLGKDGTTFAVQGEYLEIDPPHKVVMTWAPTWDGNAVTTLTYQLDATAEGTRITLHHSGFDGRSESCAGHSQGWERVLGWLSDYLVPAEVTAQKFFMCRLIGPRPTFPFDMSDAERQVMLRHAAYWTQKLGEGTAILFGPVADPKGPWGLGVVRVADQAALEAMTSNDPALLSGLGFSYEVMPMLNAVFRD